MSTVEPIADVEYHFAISMGLDTAGQTAGWTLTAAAGMTDALALAIVRTLSSTITGVPGGVQVSVTRSTVTTAQAQSDPGATEFVDY